ncbi:MAG: hypothetical protein K2Y26_00425 [Gemmatimonadaceae bacterium]|nr:hypothetical protein [Gemmatimonadaceae bacterium]
MISLATPVAAQSPTSPTEDRRFAVGLVAGASQFDLSGTGTTAIVGARFETRLRRWLLAEAALSTFRPEEQSDPRVALRAELRVRGIGRNFSGSTAEWLGGLAYRF